MGPRDGAAALQGLSDIRVRDTFLWDMAQPGTDPRAVADRLADLVRCAPAGLVAPAATALAIAHWSSGDGARANVALDRADADDPDYSLAHLVGHGPALRTAPEHLGGVPGRPGPRHLPARHATSRTASTGRPRSVARRRPDPNAGTVHRHGELAAPPRVVWRRSSTAPTGPPQLPPHGSRGPPTGVTVTSMPLTFKSGSGRPPGSTLC